MKKSPFLINDRFLVAGERNEVTDCPTGEVVRLEPRLMKLLCLLAEKQGEIVSRELIIKEIWNDYPGAGEGLNQAISFLRKLLKDDDKQLIRTLPKSGYSLNVAITQSAQKPVTKRNWQIPVAAVVVILVLAGLFCMRKSDDARPATVQIISPPKRDTITVIQKMPSQEEGRIAEANYLKATGKVHGNLRGNSDSVKKAMEEMSRNGREHARQDSVHQVATLRQNALWNTDSAKRVREERSRNGREHAKRDSTRQAETMRQNQTAIRS